jgi:hypothetical protein
MMNEVCCANHQELGGSTVFVRSKVAKGHKYYQIVEGVRDGAKVRQRVIVALGACPDPVKALKNKKLALKCHQKWRARFARFADTPKMIERRLARVDVWIAKLESEIAILENIVKNKLVVVPEILPEKVMVLRPGPSGLSAVLVTDPDEIKAVMATEAAKVPTVGTTSKRASIAQKTPVVPTTNRTARKAK